MKSEAAETVFEKHGVKAAYLFGSAARDKLREGSDIDIAIVTGENTVDTAVSAELQELFSREVEVLDLRDASLSTQFEVIRTGEPVFIDEEFDRADFEARIQSRHHDRRYYEKRRDKIALERLSR